jgi:ATP-dependent DNA helicase RecQ
LEEILAHRVQSTLERVAAMQAYANENKCRHAQIARYFGDRWGVRNCGQCDICAPRQKRTIRAAPEATTTHAVNAPHAVLSLVRDLRNFALGKNGLTQTLRGTPDAPIKPHRSPQVGALAHLRKVDIERLLDALLTQGYLWRDDSGEYPNLRLTEQGLEVLASEQEVDIEWQLPKSPATTATKSRAPLPENVDTKLLVALKAWRTGVAQEIAQPPFVVFADRVLIALATEKPANEFDLTAIPGIGPAKAARYGEAVLEIIRANR